MVSSVQVWPSGSRALQQLLLRLPRFHHSSFTVSKACQARISPDGGFLVPNDLLAETAVCTGEFQVKVVPDPW
ncbi:hypothetical protein ACH4VT_35025 [Streptomyces lydicus]|uniref:hypothetical protein n=1 Tax=Streptomyces lydicus TaxID=47763 RepID=UPI00379E734C